MSNYVVISRICLLLLVLPQGVFAEQVVKPYTFFSGAMVRSSEVNENFDVLYTQLNQAQQSIDLLKGQLDQVAGVTTVVITTNYGDITLELYAAKAPRTVANFLAYLDSGFYNDTIFHRVISGFMIQGGGFTQALQLKKVSDPIINEAGNGLFNVRGAIAMARTNEIDSATAQFFINLGSNRGLDQLINLTDASSIYGYAVFGQVVSGLDVIDQISLVETAIQGVLEDVPVMPVVISSMARQ